MVGFLWAVDEDGDGAEAGGFVGGTLYVLKSWAERRSYSTELTDALQSGHLDRSCSQLIRQRKSKLWCRHSEVVARSVMGSRQITQGS